MNTVLVPGVEWPTFTAPVRVPATQRKRKEANGFHKKRISAHVQEHSPCTMAQVKLKLGLQGGQVSHSIMQLRKEGLVGKISAGVHPRNGQEYFYLEWLGDKQ